MRKAPSRGRESSALTLSSNAALGPASCRIEPSGLLGVAGLGGIAWRVVTPPCDEDVMIGT